MSIPRISQAVANNATSSQSLSYSLSPCSSLNPFSQGFREWEYYHRLSAGTDKDRGDSQFNGVLDGKIDLWDIPQLKQTVSAQEERYARQFDIVDRLTRQVELHLRIMKQIARKLSQRKLEGEA